MTDDKGLPKKDDINIFYSPSLTNEDLSATIQLEVTMTDDIFDRVKR